MLSVTPDTVLKWTKKGRLAAIKTAGGHYRILRDSVLALLPPEDGLSGGRLATRERPVVPCWEYNAATGKIKENCRSCLVFKAKGSKCYEVGRLLREKGEGATCCPTDCEDCAYYKERKKRSIKVLIFTGNDNLKDALTKDSKYSRIRLQFTSCEYDCSLVVDSFHPEYVIVDCSIDPKECEELCKHLASDPRIPGIRIILAIPPGEECETELLGGIAVIDQPFNMAELEKNIEEFDALHKL